MTMAKCPECGSEDYDVIYIEDTEYNTSYIDCLVKVRCENCGKVFWVKEVFEFGSSRND